MIHEFHSKNVAETSAIAKDVLQYVNDGTIILLHGNLGAGKTTFVKGIAAALGVAKTITSPTFTLMNIYELSASGSKPHTLVHIDTYRLENEQELIDIGAEDYIGKPGTITIIEWPEKLSHLLQNKTAVTITIEHGSLPDERMIRIER